MTGVAKNTGHWSKVNIVRGLIADAESCRFGSSYGAASLPSHVGIAARVPYKALGGQPAFNRLLSKLVRVGQAGRSFQR